MRSSIRIYKSIHTEVSIIHLLTMITAIVVNGFPVFSYTLIYCVVTPLPYKSATHNIVLLNELEVILEISRTISHTVTIFNQQEWLASILF